MGGLGILNPAIFTAMGVVAAPLIIHLLTKRRPRDWEFPTIRFLRVAIRRKSRIHRLHELILLALRTLAIFLLVLTFSRPILRQLAHAKDGSGGNEVLILLDDSLSMGYEGNPSPFDAARAKASEILKSLTKGDLVNVWFLTQRKPLLPHFSENLGAIETALREAVPSEAAAQPVAVLPSVAEFLRWEVATSPQIYILSDFQQSNWAAVQPELLAFDAQVILVDVADDKSWNCATCGIQIRPARPAVTESVSVTCQIANYAPKETEKVVRFSLDGESPQRRTVLLPPYGTADVTFHLRFGRPGVYRGTVRTEEDRLPADDRRTAVFRVSDRIPVLLISDANPNDEKSGTYFLRRAMSPDEAGLLRVVGLAGSDIRTEELQPYEVVLISEVKMLSRKALESLREYLESGGSILYFLSRNEDRANLLGIQGIRPDQPVLPFEPKDYFDLRRFSNRSLAFAEANYDSPLLQFFRDPENGDLSKVRAYGFFTSQRTNEMGEALLTYSDGTIALAQAAVGAGNLVLANFSPQPDQSNLARRNLFVPLVHEMIQGLRVPQLEGVENRPGEATSIQIEFDTPTDSQRAAITVEGPEGEAVQALLNVTERFASVTIPRLEKTGFYNVVLNGDFADVLAVNVDPDESDLRRLPPEGLARLMEQKPSEASDVRLAPMAVGIREMREGKIVWPYILLAGLFILLLEGSLAYRWRTR